LSEKAINTTSVVTNKIHVTQGDSDGVGLEVFFKSAIMLTHTNCDSLLLYANKNAVSNTLQGMRLSFKLYDDHVLVQGKRINTSWHNGDAFECFDSALNHIQSGDVLFTLPASKKSFPSGSPGHTSYLRARFKRDLIMFFKSGDHHIGLLTDHIPLDRVDATITKELIVTTTKAMLYGANRFLNLAPKQVIFSGINPHAGENGVLGNDLELYTCALQELRTIFSAIVFDGPRSGDTIYNSVDAKTWLVYAHHDQALAPFKAMRGFNGANITLGLDFLRLSVDHGTALDIAGKDQANYLGCIYCLQLAFKALGNS
tara:strand:+ start:2751 stop:3692 length:942 start_codon:yes stop_codon:yes gene_type:complete